MRNFGLLVVALVVLFGTSCDDNEASFGSIDLGIQHLVDGSLIEFDNMSYVNEAGNPYEVSEIQWFISDISAKTLSGGLIPLYTDSEFAHYVDTDIPESMNISLDNIKAGSYSAIIITFGLKGEKNLPGAFPNPPESQMIWPFQMGGPNGGYHYMKLNGFWTDPQDVRQPFNFHLGVGKVGEDFIQNWFETEMPLDFVVKSGKTTGLALEMNVDQWFENPNVYDHNVFGGQIMNNQTAMGSGIENGKAGVFEVKVIELPQ